MGGSLAAVALTITQKEHCVRIASIVGGALQALSWWLPVLCGHFFPSHRWTSPLSSLPSPVWSFTHFAQKQHFSSPNNMAAILEDHRKGDLSRLDEGNWNLSVQLGYTGWKLDSL